MEAAWAEFHRVKANPDEWAKAQASGRRGTKSRALGLRSFGVTPCEVGQKRKRKEPAWKRKVRACFGPVASPLSLQSGPPADLPSSAPLELALAPLHLHRAHAGALECRHAARDKQERSDEAKVRAWALREPEPSLPSLPLSNPMRLPMDDEAINCCIVVPPALDIGKRLLHAYDKLKNATPENILLGARLYETWGARHDMLRHADAPAFPKAPPDTPSLRECAKCYDAGWCMCGGLPELHSPLIWFLKNNTGKGRPCKTAYEQCTLVVRLVKDDDQEELFAHIGFGNLNSLRFTVTRLHRESGEPMHAHLPGTLALRCHSLQSLNAYKFVQGVDTDWFAG